MWSIPCLQRQSLHYSARLRRGILYFYGTLAQTDLGFWPFPMFSELWALRCGSKQVAGVERATRYLGPKHTWAGISRRSRGWKRMYSYICIHWARRVILTVNAPLSACRNNGACLFCAVYLLASNIPHSRPPAPAPCEWVTDGLSAVILGHHP